MTYVTAAVASRLSVNELIAVLQTEPKVGLTNSEAIKRRHLYGYNECKDNGHPSLWRKYLEQFEQPMIVLLLVSALISLAFKQFDDAVSITVAITIVVSVAFVQELRSEKALEALSCLLPPTSRVIRDGKVCMLEAKELVPGDLIVLDNGDRVPADVRLIEAYDLLVDESTFTGETEPILKNTSEHAPKYAESIGERLNIAYMGSMIRSGWAKGIVVSTGEFSEFGAVFKMMQHEKPPGTPLRTAMDRLSRQLTIYSLAIVGFIMFIGIFQGRRFLDMLNIGVSLAVAAIPEGLPIVVTVTLALGVVRMAKKNAVVKQLSAVETMGCITVICSDKTGTLTQNVMTITRLVKANGNEMKCKSSLKFEGYFLNGIKDAEFCKILEAGILCNDAVIVDGKVKGQPTDGSFLLASTFTYLNSVRDRYIREHEWPFNPENRWMAVSVVSRSNPAERRVIMKGAPEAVFERCMFESAQQKQDLCKRVLQMSSEGLRVLALAEGCSITDLKILGLTGIMDPPRDTAYSAINSLMEYNVSVRMITGDARETAECIASQLSIGKDDNEKSLSGDEAERASEFKINDTFVFYRVSPKQKLAIIRALQKCGHIVAMVGDGVNDAVALRAADVGISIGKTATDVSREAADVVLVDDNFCAIVSSIEEGKAIFYNIENFIRFQLSTSVAALTIIAIATLFLPSSPLNAMQILWINIIMDGPPAQSLGVEPADKEIVRKPPRKPDKNIVNRQLVIDVVFKASFIVCGTLFVFVKEMKNGHLSRRDTTMTFTCFVFFDMFNALSCRSRHKPIYKIGFFSNMPLFISILFSLIGQFLVIYWPPLQYVFQTEALTSQDLFFLILISSTIFFVSELKKYLSNVLFTTSKKRSYYKFFDDRDNCMV